MFQLVQAKNRQILAEGLFLDQTFAQTVAKALYPEESLNAPGRSPHIRLPIAKPSLPYGFSIEQVYEPELGRAVDRLQYDEDHFGDRTELTLQFDSDIQVLYKNEHLDNNEFIMMTIKPIAQLRNDAVYFPDEMDPYETYAVRGDDLWEVTFKETDKITLSELQLLIEEGIVSDQDILNGSLKCLFRYSDDLDFVYKRTFEEIYLRNQKEPLITDHLFAELQDINAEISAMLIKNEVENYRPVHFIYDTRTNKAYETIEELGIFSNRVLGLNCETEADLRAYDVFVETVTGNDLKPLLELSGTKAIFPQSLYLKPVSDLNQILLPYINHVLNIDVSDPSKIADAVREELHNTYQDWVVPGSKAYNPELQKRLEIAKHSLYSRVQEYQELVQDRDDEYGQEDWHEIS